MCSINVVGVQRILPKWQSKSPWITTLSIFQTKESDAPLKVLNQISLENKFCLNFKISSSSKVKKIQICNLFWSSSIKWRLCYLLFYWMWLPHFVYYLIRFLLFLQKYPILECQISGCEWENMSHLLVPKSQKSWGKSDGQKSNWSSTFKDAFETF